MSHSSPWHYGGICEWEHYCSGCTSGNGRHEDLFMHPMCGLVACATDDDDE